MENFNHLEDDKESVKNELLAIDLLIYGMIFISFAIGLFVGYLVFV